MSVPSSEILPDALGPAEDGFLLPEPRKVDMDHLFADSAQGRVRGPDDTMPHPMFVPQSEAFPPPFDPSETTLDFLKRDRDAKALVYEAVADGTAYPLAVLPDNVLFTVRRALGAHGRQVASEKHTDPYKVDLAIRQVSDVVMRAEGAETTAYVDEATFILAALSVGHMVEVNTGDQKSPDYLEGIDAREALKQVIMGSDDRLSRSEALGPHTGEMALAAIMEYTPQEHA
ncbi:hypothetical protein KDA23_04275 [Candidatus Saccharibacteria bacterium]|nr:hypothetical protein [Candidatus Saccharibacteria bacterium]